MTVNLDQPEWNQVLAILSQAPWNVANPLLLKIGEQLRAQQTADIDRQADALHRGRPNGPLEGEEYPLTEKERQRAS